MQKKATVRRGDDPCSTMRDCPGIAAVMAADARAQDCPEWLKWACPGSNASNPAAAPGVRKEQPPARAPATPSSKMKQPRPAGTDNATVQPTRAPGPARPAQPNRQPLRGDPAGEQRLAGERPATPVMTDQEKEGLFQEFLEWQKARRPSAETER
jgi:hypothetical protein